MADRTYLGHLKRSVIAGGGLALVGIAAGVARFLVGGGTGISPMLSSLRDSGTYVGAFAAGGLTVGILFPLRHTRIGAAVVGAIAAVPVFIGISLVIEGGQSVPWVAVLGLAVPIGSWYGFKNLFVPRFLSAAEALPPIRLRTVHAT